VIIGRRVIHLPVTTSTMDEIDRFAANGEAEGIVVVADRQTAGRGRAGRGWQSAEGKDLLCSILLRPSKSAAEHGVFPLVIGLAVAEALEQLAGVHCQLKWPNDVLIGERKVAGILMTSKLYGDRIDCVNVGIGINVGADSNELPQSATSLSIETGRTLQRVQMLDALLGKLDDAYVTYCMTGSSSLVRQWLKKAAFLNERVTVESGRESITGTMIGVDEDGALLIARDDGSAERVVAGDLVRGPRRHSS
jgi:BirA family biotin operon repressor/biotin-[acetyl-CoA-carboxylase] ligase